MPPKRSSKLKRSMKNRNTRKQGGTRRIKRVRVCTHGQTCRKCKNKSCRKRLMGG